MDAALEQELSVSVLVNTSEYEMLKKHEREFLERMSAAGLPVTIGPRGDESAFLLSADPDARMINFQFVNGTHDSLSLVRQGIGIILGDLGCNHDETDIEVKFDRLVDPETLTESSTV